MLTVRQQFKVAFLRRCAEAGLTREETHEVVKCALDQVKEGGLLDIFKGPAKSLSNVGIGTMLLAPPAIGYGVGRFAAKATDLQDEDVAEMKKRRLIEEYLRLAKDVKSKRKTYL